MPFASGMGGRREKFFAYTRLEISEDVPLSEGSSSINIAHRAMSSVELGGCGEPLEPANEV
uniref:Uncharacterized protein n=1 Tax=Fervidicoccus fontis TaxID=683846 RepID=A0A7J3SL76_9CREN